MISVIQNVHCSFISTQTKESNILHIFGIVFDNLAGFTKDACVSLLLGQVWYEQLTDKSKLYLKQLNKEIVQGVSKNDINSIMNSSTD